MSKSKSRSKQPRPGARVEPAPPAEPRSLWPPRRLVISLCSLAAAAAMVRAGLLEPVVGGVVDGAVRNILTVILGFSALMSAVLWFVRESGHSPAWKRGLAFGLLGLVALGLATLRVERVSGNLVPEFRWVWQKSRDTLLARAVALPQVANAAPWQPAPHDFPRFLGPAGDASLPASAPRLASVWKKDQPPRELWRRPIGAGWGGFATCGDHAVTLEQRGDEEIITCLSLASGEPQWQVAVTARHQTVLGGAGPRSTPAIHDGVVYTAGATGWLFCVDGATGKVLWKKDVLADLGIDAAAHALAVAWGRAGSPLILGDVVVVPGGGPRGDGPVALVAYDRATGERRWNAGDDQISYVSPSLFEIGGKPFLVAVTESQVIGFDPASRDEAWRFPWPGHSNSDASCTQAVVIGPNRLFISKGYGIGAAAFDVEPGADGAWTVKEAWRNKAGMKTKFTNVAFHDGHLYGLSDGILECLRASDGKRMWKGGRYDQGQLLRVGDLLVVQSEPGDVVLVEATPEAHREVARLAALSDQTWNSPAIVGDRLLVRNAVEAACYQLPLRTGAAAADHAVPAGGALPAAETPPSAEPAPEHVEEKPAV
ncbi:MAG: PQQ-binding-like beta-propeller repeat protein [Planctomycetota bacterium]|nr:PQQ-binding-like beta-propeller repeat protein [Planctomycetota bacterium]